MKPEEMVDARFRVQAVRSLRTAVLDVIDHREWRRIIRDTYPSSMTRVGTTWVRLDGREIDWTATEVYTEALREDLEVTEDRATGEALRENRRRLSSYRPMVQMAGRALRPPRVPLDFEEKLIRSRLAEDDLTIRDTVTKVRVMRPGVEPQTARAVIEALLVIGWRPPEGR